MRFIVKIGECLQEIMSKCSYRKENRGGKYHHLQNGGKSEIQSAIEAIQG